MGLLYPFPEGEQSTARIPAPGVVEHMIRAVFRRREVADRLAILDRDAGALPCPEAREAARRVAAEVRATLRASQRSNIPGNSGAESCRCRRDGDAAGPGAVASRPRSAAPAQRPVTGSPPSGGLPLALASASASKAFSPRRRARALISSGLPSASSRPRRRSASPSSRPRSVARSSATSSTSPDLRTRPPSSMR